MPIFARFPPKTEIWFFPRAHMMDDGSDYRSLKRLSPKSGRRLLQITAKMQAPHFLLRDF